MQHKCTDRCLGILRIPKNFWAKIIRLTLFMHAFYGTLLHSIHACTQNSILAMHSPNIELLPEMNRKSLQTYNATKPTSIFFVVFCNVRVYAGVYHVNLT